MTGLSWDELAELHEYADPTVMLTTLYGRYQSIAKLARRLGVPPLRLRRELRRLQIPIRPQGGPNHVKLTVDVDELYGEVEEDGLRAVAKRLKVHENTVRRALKQAGYL